MSRSGSEFSLYTAQGKRKYLNQDERRRFLAAAQSAPPAVRTFCMTLAYTGFRISEALSMTADCLQRESGVVSVICLKKRRKLVVREVPVPAKLLAQLCRMQQGGSARLWPWGRTTAWRAVKGVMAAAEIGSLPASPKGLRHGFGVHAVQSGVPLNLIQKWLGHADIATTAIYTNALGPEERSVAARMW